MVGLSKLIIRSPMVRIAEVDFTMWSIMLGLSQAMLKCSASSAFSVVVVFMMVSFDTHLDGVYCF